MIEQLKGRRERLLPAVRLALRSGMRRGEILRLKREDLNFSEKTVSRTIRGEIWRVPPGWLLIEKSKNGRPRTIPVSGKVREMLYHLSQDAACPKYVFENIRTGSRRGILRHSATSATDGYTHSSYEARERAMELVADYRNYGKITATAFLEAVAV